MLGPKDIRDDIETRQCVALELLGAAKDVVMQSLRYIGEHRDGAEVTPLPRCEGVSAAMNEIYSALSKVEDLVMSENERADLSTAVFYAGGVGGTVSRAHGGLVYEYKVIGDEKDTVTLRDTKTLAESTVRLDSSEARRPDWFAEICAHSPNMVGE
jgi:hypothetical protein